MEYDEVILRGMSFFDLIGAIFVRSQLIEQIMRELLLAKEDFSKPTDFDRKTYGWLLNEISKHYPEINDNNVPTEWKKHVDFSLYSSLKDANEVRNDAAHGEYLTHITIRNLMPDKHANGIGRITMKATRENAEIMNNALIEIWNFRADLVKPT